MEITRIENLELLAQQIVEGFIIGLHRSPFHGFSVEFAEYRLYNPGDPLKHIDWRVFGRTDKLFIKKFEEETNLRCCIAIDQSSSMLFPFEENKLNKLQFSCLAAASLFELLKKQLDATALATFDEQIQNFSACRSSHTHYRSLLIQLNELLALRKLNTSSNIAATLHLIAEKMHKRSMIIVFSDFMEASNEANDLFNALQHLKYNKHEVILFQIMDGEREVDFNLQNKPLELIDMEGSETIKLQPAHFKEAYQQAMNEWKETFTAKCRQYQIELIDIDLRKDISKVLYNFLLKRNKLL